MTRASQSGQVLQFRRRDRDLSEPVVTGAYLARHLSVTVRTLRRWQGQGMPSLKSRNGARRYRVSEVEQWLEQT